MSSRFKPDMNLYIVLLELSVAVKRIYVNKIKCDA